MHEESGPSWGMRGLRKWLGTAPETRDELLKLVQDSRRFLEPDTVAMLEGVLDLPATKVREVMTPRTSMIAYKKMMSYSTFCILWLSRHIHVSLSFHQTNQTMSLAFY